MQLRSARSGIRTHPLQTLFLAIFARRTLYSWPLLVDGAGDGYFYSTLSRRVFHRFEGERDPFFPSFEGFVDFLVQLANMKETSVEGRIERELELLDQSAR